LHEHVHAEAAGALELAREVDVVLLLEARTLLRAHDRVDQLDDALGRQHRLPLHADQVAADAQARRLAGAEMQVRGAESGRGAEQVVHRGHADPPGREYRPTGPRTLSRPETSSRVGKESEGMLRASHD